MADKKLYRDGVDETGKYAKLKTIAAKRIASEEVGETKPKAGKTQKTISYLKETVKKGLGME